MPVSVSPFSGGDPTLREAADAPAGQRAAGGKKRPRAWEDRVLAGSSSSAVVRALEALLAEDETPTASLFADAPEDRAFEAPSGPAAVHRAEAALDPGAARPGRISFWKSGSR